MRLPECDYAFMAEKPAIRSSNDLCVYIIQVFARSEINGKLVLRATGLILNSSPSLGALGGSTDNMCP